MEDHTDEKSLNTENTVGGDNPDTLWTLSPSQYTQFIHCRYAWYLSYLADVSRIWPDSGYTGHGISLKPEYLPTPMKMGAIWDIFQNYYYEHKTFKPAVLMTYCDHYNLDDYSTAKLFALVKAWYKMEFAIDRDDCQTQFEFHKAHHNFAFHGFMDVHFPTYIVENKLSGMPRRFEKIQNFHDQAAIYLLSDPSLQYIIIRAVQVPQLRPKKLETSQEFRDRCVDDIISSPSKYFIGYDRKQSTFGLKFWRKEFDLDGIVKDFEHVYSDIFHCQVNRALCYQDRLSCYVPAQCIYLPICESGAVNDEIYEPRDKSRKANPNPEMKEG